MNSREGFTLVELIVAVVLLAVGVLGFVGSTTFLRRQATIADLRAERASATANVIERLRSMPFDSIEQGRDSIGPYEVTWTTQRFYTAKSVAVVVRGPGYAPARSGGMPGLTANLEDTVVYRVPKP